MAFSINEMRANLQYGGARPSLFQVTITNPVNAAFDSIAPFMIRASRYPSATLGVVKVPYFGREINLAGTRKFEEWNTVVINDEDWGVRNALETWSTAINSLEGNITTLSSSAPSLYKSQATITAYGKDGSINRIYQFTGLWPSQISPIETDWNNGDAIMEYQVTWQYDYWTVTNPSSGTPNV